MCVANFTYVELFGNLCIQAFFPSLTEFHFRKKNLIQLNGTELKLVISCDPMYSATFTAFPLKPLSNQQYGRYHRFSRIRSV